MPSWGEIQNKISRTRSPYDELRDEYISQISQKTKRNVIVYYSGWLQKPEIKSPVLSINDDDKNGFMICCHGLDRTKGLDLILHTPGGDVGATESLIDYLYLLFKGDVRAIIPQLSMSGGTLLALSSKQIIMGNESSLGPIDPQFGPTSAQSYLDEFKKAINEVKEDPAKIAIWQLIIGKMNPGFLTTCHNAVLWSKEILDNVLRRVMFSQLQKTKQNQLIRNATKLFCNSKVSKNHARHITKEKAREAGLDVLDLEADNDLQDRVLSLHHLLCQSFQDTPNLKIISSGAKDRTYIVSLKFPQH